jgi:hypothetical protein
MLRTWLPYPQESRDGRPSHSTWIRLLPSWMQPGESAYSYVAVSMLGGIRTEETVALRGPGWILRSVP